jgi:hypothetical protein
MEHALTRDGDAEPREEDVLAVPHDDAAGMPVWNGRVWITPVRAAGSLLARWNEHWTRQLCVGE